MKTLKFNNRFIDELPADSVESNSRRQVYGACYSFVEPTPVIDPSLVSASKEAAEFDVLRRSSIW